MAQEILSSQKEIRYVSVVMRALKSYRRKCLKPLNSLNLQLERHSQRKRLLQLSEAQLADIGISRQEAIEEANKHFWQ